MEGPRRGCPLLSHSATVYLFPSWPSPPTRPSAPGASGDCVSNNCYTNDRDCTPAGAAFKWYCNVNNGALLPRRGAAAACASMPDGLSVCSLTLRVCHDIGKEVL